MKLVEIAHLAGDEKVQMIYTFHIYFKDQRKSKSKSMHFFQAWNFMYIANPEVYFRDFDGFMKKLFWQLNFFVGSQGWSLGLESYDAWMN